jgi:hypothetical protein
MIEPVKQRTTTVSAEFVAILLRIRNYSEEMFGKSVTDKFIQTLDK